MMPGFCHRNRKNKTGSKGERCFYLNTGNDHSSTTHKILLSSGVCSRNTRNVRVGMHGTAQAHLGGGGVQGVRRNNSDGDVSTVGGGIATRSEHHHGQVGLYVET